MNTLQTAAISVLVGLSGCSDTPEKALRKEPSDAVAVAVAYASDHFPKGTFQPNGARLQHTVEDEGNVWKVELSPEGYIGGGLQVVVRKTDMSVTSALRTQ